MGAQIRNLPFRFCEGALLCALFSSSAGAKAQVAPLPAGVEKLCVIQFDRDQKRPARVEDSALPCLELAVKRMTADATVKLVLVGVKDPAKDHEASENGRMRETEDTTGYDIRLEDLAAYRSLNTKGYLVRWYRIDPARILPTTDESAFGADRNFLSCAGRCGLQP